MERGLVLSDILVRDGFGGNTGFLTPLQSTSVNFDWGWQKNSKKYKNTGSYNTCFWGSGNKKFASRGMGSWHGRIKMGKKKCEFFLTFR